MLRSKSIKFISILLAIAGGWVAIAPMIGMGSVGIALLFIAFATIAVIISANSYWGRTIFQRVLLTLAAPVLAYLLMFITTWGMNAYLFWHPPARPMFHNQFTRHERVLLPFWQMETHRYDDWGVWFWADFNDNILVVVATGSGLNLTSPNLSPSVNETKLTTGDYLKSASFKIARQPNTLVVVLPNDVRADFSLPAGRAKDFTDSHNPVADRNILKDLRPILNNQELVRFDAFTKQYKEPRPNKD